MRIAILSVFTLCLLSCAVNNNEVDGPVFCTIDQTDTYDVGTDPGVDFNETNRVRTRVFNNTDCPGVNVDAFDSFVSRVKRVGGLLQVFENQYQSNQFLLEFEVQGNTLLPIRNQFRINNCSIIREWSGVLNTPGTTVTINELITYKGACQSTFIDPDFDNTIPDNK